MDSQLFRGVHYEICGYDETGNEWIVHSTRKATVGDEIGLRFDAEAIHVMRFGETEEEFDKRLEAYDEVGYVNENQRFLFGPICTLDRLFVVAPIVLVVYYSFFDIEGDFTLGNYQNSLHRFI